MDEHRVIERVLASLEAAAARIERGGPIRPGFFTDAADFIKGFADGCHHRKEEGALFPALEEAGVPREGGPIGVMLREHDEGRQLVRNMRGAAERLAAGDSKAGAEVAANARDYAALLRQHIMKEDRVLFPLADRVIQGAASDALLENFRHVEHEEAGAGIHEKYLALATSLERELQAEDGVS